MKRLEHLLLALGVVLVVFFGLLALISGSSAWCWFELTGLIPMCFALGMQDARHRQERGW